MNSSYISKTVKSTLTTALIVPFLFAFNVNSAHAELDSQASKRVSNLNLTVKSDTAKVRGNNTDLASNYKSIRSNKYLRLGIEAQEAENPDLALKYYAEAVTIDPENANAWLWTGTLLGKSPMGIKALKLSALLFQIQEDSKGFETAIAWLHEFGVED
jgi:tetratricopeptide (TPR) repeat protein